MNKDYLSGYYLKLYSYEDHHSMTKTSVVPFSPIETVEKWTIVQSLKAIWSSLYGEEQYFTVNSAGHCRDYSARS